MNRLLSYKNKWYIGVIIVGVLILSLLSWASFAKWVNFEAESYNDAGNSNLITYALNKLDSAIDKIDSVWSVYKKDKFSKIDNRVTYYCIGEISSVQVLQGNNKWLFYKSKSDGDPIADYEGTNCFTQEELQSMAKVALSTQNKIESEEINFALIVAPNKENIYAEYMPDNYNHSDQSRTDILIQYLQNYGVNVASPKNELLENHTQSQVYYSYDTHWNQLGAYIGVKDALAIWDINLPELSDRAITSGHLKENYHYCGEDDLARMVDLLSAFNDEIEYTVDDTILMDWESYEEEQNSGQVSYFKNPNADNKGVVFLVGDSFRSSMIPSLREEFTDVYVVHRSYYDPSMLNEIKPDYLLVEYVERYSNKIKQIDELIR